MARALTPGRRGPSRPRRAPVTCRTTSGRTRLLGHGHDRSCPHPPGRRAQRGGPGLARQLVGGGEDGRVPGQGVLVNGDSHYLGIDKRLLDAKKQMVENFALVQTFGDAETHRVEAEVDPKDPNTFTFHPRIVAANVEQHLS